MPSNSQHVTFIGAGNMGSALIRGLLKAGTQVTVWNRTPERPQVKSVVTAGAKFEADIKTAISKSDGVILFSMLDYDAIYQALQPISSSSTAFGGKTIVNLTNGTPREARETDAWMKEHGAVRYFDGAVMVTPDLIGTEQAFLLYSGESEDVFQQHIKGLVEPLGKMVYNGPDVDAAAVHDLAGLASMFGLFSGALVGMGLLSRLSRQSGDGVPRIAPGVAKVMVPLIREILPFVQLMAGSADAKTWDDNLGLSLGMLLAEVNNVVKACREEGVDASGLQSLASIMERVAEERGGDGGLAQVGQHLLLN